MQNLKTEEHNFQEDFENTKPFGEKGAIPTSKDITGIEIRLSNVTVLDNKTPKVFPFPGLAKIYFVNVVASDLSAQSISLNLHGFEKINDGDRLNVDRAIFFWQKGDSWDTSTPPSQIHIFTSLIKSKQPLRDVAKVMRDVKEDNNYKDVVSNLNTILKSTSNLTSISNVAFQVAGIIGNYLGKVDDKPLLSWMQSFTNLHADFDTLGETDKSASNKYASMNLNLFVRDRDRAKSDLELAQGK